MVDTPEPNPSEFPGDFFSLPIPHSPFPIPKQKESRPETTLFLLANQR
jgi:hypothetical protein